MPRLLDRAVVAVTVTLFLLVSPLAIFAESPQPISVGSFRNDVRHTYKLADGTTLDKIRSITIGSDGNAIVGTSTGIYGFNGKHWVQQLAGDIQALAMRGGDLIAVMQNALYQIDKSDAKLIVTLPAELASSGSINSLAAGEAIWIGTNAGLWRVSDGQASQVEGFIPASAKNKAISQVAVAKSGRVAVAAAGGLFVASDENASAGWERVLPSDGNKSWAPIDVNGAAFDGDGHLWFATAQGVGGETEQGWKLYTGKEGLPFNEFTTMSASESGVVWFGTTQGAIRLDDGKWSYRNGQRWMPSGAVRSISVTPKGNTWFGTDEGVSLLESREVTLAEKAKYYEDEIDKYHRRTPFGYVMSVHLKTEADKSTAETRDSDNDGLWTSMYGAGECFAYAATQSPEAKKRADKAFEALAFLSEVTQGGSHPAPFGYPARTILPTSGENPNDVRYTPEKDRARQQREDPLWKIMDPRWPTSEDGKWYWKADTSSDELDGHYFFYACYYDLVAQTEEEKQAVRKVVSRITTHLVDHDFNLVDPDGKPTRWAYFGPDRLNEEINFARGLNSLSILSYLKTAIHICGDKKFVDAYRMLIDKHHYAVNTLWPKAQTGPGTGNQSDDEMAFMCYYNLLNYEEDPDLLAIYHISLLRYWGLEAPEACPLFNFIYAASLDSDVLKRHFRINRFPIPETCLSDAVDTLKRIPLDRIRWGYKNSHRIDVVRLGQQGWSRGAKGHLANGKVLPIDERDLAFWNHDPWRLDEGGNGHSMSDGATFLLPYYMGLYLGFIEETGK